MSGLIATEEDSHSPSPDVHRSTTTQNIVNDEEKQQKCDDQDNENDCERQDKGYLCRNPATLMESDLLGLGNYKEVNDAGTYATKTENSKSKMLILPDRNRIGDDDEQEVIYDFPPGLSTLNVNGRPRLELVTVRKNGRLQMFMVPNLSPQLVRSPGRNGRLKMWLLNDDRLAGEHALPPVRRSI